MTYYTIEKRQRADGNLLYRGTVGVKEGGEGGQVVDLIKRYAKDTSFQRYSQQILSPNKLALPLLTTIIKLSSRSNIS